MKLGRCLLVMRVGKLWSVLKCPITYIYTQYEISKLMGSLKYMLRPNYDVVLEKDHIHIEYDPK